MSQPKPTAAAKMLDIVRKLSLEMRPGARQLADLGLDHALERDLGVKLAEAAIAEAETPRDLLQELGGSTPGTSVIWPPASFT